MLTAKKIETVNDIEKCIANCPQFAKYIDDQVEYYTAYWTGTELEYQLDQIGVCGVDPGYLDGYDNLAVFSDMFVKTLTAAMEKYDFHDEIKLLQDNPKFTITLSLVSEYLKENTTKNETVEKWANYLFEELAAAIIKCNKKRFNIERLDVYTHLIESGELDEYRYIEDGENVQIVKVL